jgi:hypothetical protein
VSVENVVVNFPIKGNQLLIFSVFHGGLGRGARTRTITTRTTTTTTTTTTTAKVLLPLASWSLFVSRLAQGCTKGDPQT